MFRPQPVEIGYEIREQVRTSQTVGVDDFEGVYFIGTKHEQFAGLRLPFGSVALGPWRYIDFAGENVNIIQIGNSA